MNERELTNVTETTLYKPETPDSHEFVIIRSLRCVIFLTGSIKDASALR